jgi:hypothetical protein
MLKVQRDVAAKAKSLGVKPDEDVATTGDASRGTPQADAKVMGKAVKDAIGKERANLASTQASLQTAHGELRKAINEGDTQGALEKNKKLQNIKTKYAQQEEKIGSLEDLLQEQGALQQGTTSVPTNTISGVAAAQEEGAGSANVAYIQEVVDAVKADDAASEAKKQTGILSDLRTSNQRLLRRIRGTPDTPEGMSAAQFEKISRDIAVSREKQEVGSGAGSPSAQSINAKALKTNQRAGMNPSQKALDDLVGEINTLKKGQENIQGTIRKTNQKSE